MPLTFPRINLLQFPRTIEGFKRRLINDGYEPLFMPRVLITGGAGFIGSHTARLAQRTGWSLRILDNLSTGLKSTFQSLGDEGIEVIRGDLRDPLIIDEAILECDAVINLAAQVSVPFSMDHPEENHAINVEGTNQLIEAAKRHNVSRFITASSAAVYGVNDAFPLCEDDAGDYHSPYAESKWLNEKEILAAREQGMESVALRFFNVYGSGQRADGAYAAVIPKFIELITQGKQPTIFGDGLQTRDFVHVKDVARALLMFCSVNWKPEFHHVYNIATQTEVSLLTLIQLIDKTLASMRPAAHSTKPLHKHTRPGDIQRSIANIQRIQNDTQWSPEISFEDGLRLQVLDALNTK